MRFRTAGIFAIFVEHEAGNQNQLSCSAEHYTCQTCWNIRACESTTCVQRVGSFHLYPVVSTAMNPFQYMNHPKQISFHEWTFTCPAAVQQLNPCWQQQFNYTSINQVLRFSDLIWTLFQWPFQTRSDLHLGNQNGHPQRGEETRWNLGTFPNWHLFMMGYYLHLKVPGEDVPILEMNDCNWMVGALEFWEGFGGLSDTTKLDGHNLSHQQADHFFGWWIP